MNWIQGPWVDLCFFSFGWLPIFLAFCVERKLTGHVPSYSLIVVLVLAFNFLHRHITFPLVYGDPEQFQSRKKSYVLLPIFFLAVTMISLAILKEPGFQSKEIADPVRISAGDKQVFQVKGDDFQEELTVVFTGMEQSVSEVASRLNEGLGGYLTVKAVGNRLDYSVPKSSAVKSWSIGFSSGRYLKASLGIEGLKSRRFQRTLPFYLFLVVAATLWNMYHTIMQKAGIMRIYSRRDACGKPWLDKSIVWMWFIAMFCALAAMPTMRAKASSLAYSGSWISATVKPLEALLPWMAALAGLTALVLTILYLKQEMANPKGFQWPKTIFLFSLILIYGVFFFDFLVGFAVMSFSHALEYLAIVYIFSRKKYLSRPAESSQMARWVRREALSFGFFTVVMLLLFSGLRWISQDAMDVYIVGSSFLHYLYDGWIWKVRDPKVGEGLGIAYPAPQTLRSA